MQYLVYPLAVAILSLAACTSQETMAKHARISSAEATRKAEMSVPGGKTKSVHLETEEGRTVYEVELVDNKDNSQTVWIDAQTGQVVKRDK